MLMSKLVKSISQLIQKHEVFRKNDLADKGKKIKGLMTAVEDEIKLAVTNNLSNLIVKYSSGSGNNPKTPIVYFYDKRETTKGTEGVYCVLLFRCLPDKDTFGEVVLALSQGEEVLKAEKPKTFQLELNENAKSICESHCHSLKKLGFKLSNEEELGSPSRIVEKTFNISTLKSDQEIVADIKTILKTYTQFVDVKMSDNQLSRDLADIKGTSRTQLIEARLGQGKYRKDLFSVWKGQCCMSGCEQAVLLRASHIKPWRSCTDKERLDPMNGLLLVPNLDVVFDQGYISFDADGEIVISNELDADSINILNIPKKFRLSLNQEQGRFMEYHRGNIFRGCST
jgi:hypothetical protein